MEHCTIETGLLRKKPCGHPAVTKCQNCEQPLCLSHAVPQMADGKKTGKFMCQECVKALKDHDKAVAAGTRHVQEKKMAALEKTVKEEYGKAPPPMAKKPGAPAPAPAAGAAPAQPAEKATEPEALEFTPKDGKFGYTPKKDDKGFKGE